MTDDITMSKPNDTGGIIEILEESGEPLSIEMTSKLEQRGRKCISQSMLKKAEAARKNASNDVEIIENLAKAHQYVKLEGGKTYMVYPHCFCLKNVKGVPAGYCECSRGYVMEVFERALGRPVDVIIESTVIRGGKECRFRVLV